MTEPTKPENPSAFQPSYQTQLRDCFAGLALQGMIASGREWDGSTESRIALYQADRFAMAAYEFADAMLRAREAK